MLNGNKFAELSEQYQEVKIFALELAVERFSNVMWVMQQILFYEHGPQAGYFFSAMRRLR